MAPQPWSNLTTEFYLVDSRSACHRLRPPHTYTFGSGELVNFRLNDRRAVRRHCELRWDMEQGWVAIDLSGGATTCNGERLARAKVLRDGDHLQIGEERFTFLVLPRGSDPAAYLQAASKAAAGGAAGGGGASFDGDLSPGGLLAVLEFLHSTRKTGVLRLMGGDARRAVWVEKGEPVDACSGMQEGEDALRSLVAGAAPGTRFTFNEGESPTQGRRIATAGAHLLAALARGGGEDSGDIGKARSLQERLVARLPSVPGYELVGHYEPMAGVGGDFYDVGPLGRTGNLIITLGDVSGHGVQGALAVALALKSLRLLRRSCTTPADLLVHLGEELRGDLLPGQFVTVFAASLDPASGRIGTVLAGHHPAFLRRASGAVERIGRSGMAVGLADPALLGRTLHEQQAQLAPGDLLLQCTDGLLESHSPGGDEEFGEERVVALLGETRKEGAEAVLKRLCSELRRFAGEENQDDLTLLALARAP